MPSPAPDATRVPIGLSLGSNLGDAPANLAAALRAVSADGRISVDAVSSVYRTRPWGPVPQPDFANLCALARTALLPHALLDELKAIETACGRTPGARWGPRQIDIDIVFYGDMQLDTARLTLPHREAHRRAFVLVPLAELAPDHMIGGSRVADLAATFDANEVALWSRALQQQRGTSA